MQVSQVYTYTENKYIPIIIFQAITERGSNLLIIDLIVDKPILFLKNKHFWNKEWSHFHAGLILISWTMILPTITITYRK